MPKRQRGDRPLPPCEENSREPYVHSDLGVYYAKLGESELAHQRAGTAVSLAPDSGEIISAAAEAHELVGEREKAVELVRRSLDLGYPIKNYQTNPEFESLLAETQF